MMYAFKEIPVSPEATNPPCPFCDRAGTIDLVDGDTIPMDPNMNHARVTGGKMALSLDGYCFSADLVLGVCNSCKGESYFVHLELVHAADVTEEWASKYFNQNEVITEPSSFFRAQAHLPDVPQAWFIERTPTPLGVIERHYLGPFITEEKLIGPHGVANCGKQTTWGKASELVYRLWPRVAVDPAPHCIGCGTKLPNFDCLVCEDCHYGLIEE